MLPCIIAVLAMTTAWAAATTGQDARRARDQVQLNFDRYYWEWELDQAKLAHKPDAEIAKIEKIVASKRTARVISYARYGRQFTPWDGYRYEEIIDQGYIFHQPFATDKEKENSLIDAGGPEKRSKNVVWYPLYPMLASGLMYYLPLSSTNALTVVSWACCLLAALVLFSFARRHFYHRRAELKLGEMTQGIAAYDMAALWTTALLLAGPCSIFLYANFTESLFVLLLALFLYCMQARWWWRAALVAAFASASRSQGVLFGPILALTYFLRGNSDLLKRLGRSVAAFASAWRSHGILFGAMWALPYLFRGNGDLLKRLAGSVAMGFISGLGLLCYMLFLRSEFDDPLAFMHAQRYWNVGISLDRILFAANPANAEAHILGYLFFKGEIDWPRLWEALCLIWPPCLLLTLGWRYLSFELNLFGWILWGLPYVSNSMAGNPPFDTQWMSMGRFMAVVIPIYIIFGAVLARRPWLAPFFAIPWITAFGIFAYKYGTGAWVG